MLPAETHPLSCHIPSDSCHLQFFITTCTPTITKGCSYSLLLPQLRPCAPILFPFDHCYTLRPELPLGNGKALQQLLCKNSLNPTLHLEKAAAKPQGTVQQHSPTEETLLKSHSAPNTFSQPEHNENHFSNICTLFWKTQWKYFRCSGRFSLGKEGNRQSYFVCFNSSLVKL